MSGNILRITQQAPGEIPSMNAKKERLNQLLFKQQLSQSVLIFLAILYSSTQILAIIIVGKLVATPVGSISAGSMVAPFWFLFNDMIAELYGYKISRIIFWSAMLSELIFAIAAMVILHFPSPVGWLGSSAFSLVLGHLPFIYSAHLLAIIFGWYVNTKFLLRWKFLLRGQFFWLRSIGSSAIGEIVFSVIAASIIMSGLMSSWETHSNYKLVIHLVIWSALLKIISTAFFSTPIAIIVSLLKRVGVGNEFNPILNPFQVSENK